MRVVRRHFGKYSKSHSHSALPSSAQLSVDSYLKSSASRSLFLEDKSLSETWSLFLKSVSKSYRETSTFSKLLATSLLSLTLFGDYLDRKFIEYRNPNGIYSFLTDSPEEMIMNVCQTGDVIVFQRPIMSFNPLNILRTSLRQFACDGPYDHCAVIVHNEHEAYFPFIVEIDQNYHKKIRITPFDERILTAREGSIFVRQIHKSDKNNRSALNRKLSDWIDYKINGFDESIHNKQYIDDIETFFADTNISNCMKRDSLFSLVTTLCFNGDNTVQIRSAIRDLTRKIKQLQYEITTQLKKKKQPQLQMNMSIDSAIAVMDHKRYGRVRNIDHLIKEIRILKLQRLLKKDNLQKREKYIRQRMKINSSQFVGYFWRYLGVLDTNGAKPCEIRPQHFADSKIEIPMKGTTRLGHVQFVKTQNETHKINDSQQARYRASKLNKWEQKESEQ